MLDQQEEKDLLHSIEVHGDKSGRIMYDRTELLTFINMSDCTAKLRILHKLSEQDYTTLFQWRKPG